MDHSATYSPEDNKLRLYSAYRLDKETYARVRNAGFIWAGKQELFVAPMWTPEREDFLIELCGDIGDEDKSLVERAEDRAERFSDYSDHRAQDAEAAHKAVHAIADHIPLGQPILVGHHSERHARRDAEKIENGMRRAVQMWRTSEYWKDRAAGAIRHAKYKERPDVRARRIKGLGADQRKQERYKQEAALWLKLWTECQNEPDKDLQMKAALRIAAMCWLHLPRKEGDRPDFAHTPTAHDALTNAHPSLYAPRTLDEIFTHAQAHYPPYIAHCDRWIEHYTNRLQYERAMLDEQGASDLLKPKPKPPQLPLCNYRAPEGLDIPNPWSRGEVIHYPQVEMTQAEYASINIDYKATRVVGNSHRVRTAMRHHSLVCVFLTDSKIHTRPAAIAPKSAEEPRHREPRPAPAPDPQAEKFEALAETLKAGIQVVSAPQLFPTPPELAARMVELAEIEDGQQVLEPSAGTGAIVDAIRVAMAKGTAGRCAITAVEINQNLAHRLAFVDCLGGERVHPKDFLECDDELGEFERILMNPPFENGADIKHIQHAYTFLKPGGILVAICANGPRQSDKLKPLAGYWEDLPAGTFAAAGTNVNTALLVWRKAALIDAEQPAETAEQPRLF